MQNCDSYNVILAVLEKEYWEKLLYFYVNLVTQFLTQIIGDR